MYMDFKAKFANIMAAAGYESIDPGLYEPWPLGFALWGKLSGAVAYYYALYEVGGNAAQMAAYDGLKAHVDRRFAGISARFAMRHSVVFNIFAGDLSKDVREIERLINEPGEFAYLPKYDIYYGVDTANGRIMRNSKQPANMDGSLDKLQAALAAPQTAGDAPLSAPPPIPPRYAVPVAKQPIFCYVIMAINLLLYVAMELSGGSTDIETLVRFGAVSQSLVFGMGEYHRLFTPMFLHIGLMHLIFNTASMVLFGIRAERYFGHVKFLAIYIVSGFAGNLAMALASPIALGAGASGSIYGLLGALFAFTVLRRQNVENFRASVLGIMILAGILMGFTMNDLPGMPNVANAAHIGGLAAGALLGYLLAGIKNRK